jgi:hypothetical protein
MRTPCLPINDHRKRRLHPRQVNALANSEWSESNEYPAD